MVGWVSKIGDTWDDIGHKMKHRLRKCLESYLIADLSATANKRKEKLASGMTDAPYWTVSSFEWDPIECSSANFHFARRLRGRPAVRWHNILI